MPRQKPAPLSGDSLLDYGLKTLRSRAMSAADLRTRLKRRAAAPAEVDAVIAKLQGAGFIDDRRFAEAYAAARLENQGFGRMRVLRDLRQHRVAGDVAGDAVERTFEGADEVALIEQFLARKYRGKDLPAFLTEDKNLVSTYRRLRLAGFGSSTSIGVLKRYAASAEALEDAQEEEP